MSTPTQIAEAILKYYFWYIIPIVIVTVDVALVLFLLSH
mgnify:CR=1 FL=1